MADDRAGVVTWRVMSGRLMSLKTTWTIRSTHLLISGCDFFCFFPLFHILKSTNFFFCYPDPLIAITNGSSPMRVRPIGVRENLVRILRSEGPLHDFTVVSRPGQHTRCTSMLMSSTNVPCLQVCLTQPTTTQLMLCRDCSDGSERCRNKPDGCGKAEDSTQRESI